MLEIELFDLLTDVKMCLQIIYLIHMEKTGFGIK